MSDKILSVTDLKEIRARHGGERIVLCHGVFDLFHFGHLAHLKSAKAFGDRLIVSLTADRFVQKGPGRPRYPQERRAEILAALELVDYVTINESPTAIPVIQSLRPHFYVKGPDYQNKEKDLTGRIFDEEHAINAVGGAMVFTNDETESSSALINQYLTAWDEQQKQMLAHLRKSFGLEQILELIDSMSRSRVLVVGEPIVDSYVFCKPEALSSKSPTVSMSYQYAEDYAGGSLAIANHLASLGCEVTLQLTHGSEDYFLDVLEKNLHPRVSLEAEVLKSHPTPRKTRYMVPFKAQSVFELQHLKSDQWLHYPAERFTSRLLSLASSHDLMIVADFGHGLFEGPVLKALADVSTFLALNVQTNSGNFGFNPFTKHARFDYLSLDERECRIAMHDRLTPIQELATHIASLHPHQRTSVTLGTEGSLYFPKADAPIRCPTFFRDVLDTVGAGDAYFALTSLLVKHDAPAAVIPFLGNCFAGLKSRTMGNKAPVQRSEFLKTVSHLLK